MAGKKKKAKVEKAQELDAKCVAKRQAKSQANKLATTDTKKGYVAPNASGPRPTRKQKQAANRAATQAASAENKRILGELKQQQHTRPTDTQSVEHKWGVNNDADIQKLRNMSDKEVQKKLMKGIQNKANRKGGTFTDFVSHNGPLLRDAFRLGIETEITWQAIMQSRARMQTRR